MSKELVNSGIEWMGVIPKDWKKVRLKDNFEFEKGKNAAKYTAEYLSYNIGDYPVYSGQTENDGVMGKINSYDYDMDECLFTTTVGAKVMTLKKLYNKFSLSQNCLIMKKLDGKININYYYYILQSLFDYEKTLIPSYMQPSLRIEDLKKYKFYVPSVEKQSKFANYLDKRVSIIDEIIVKNQKEIELLEEYKQSLINNELNNKTWRKVRIKNTSYLKGRIGWQGLTTNDYQEQGPYLITGTDFNDGVINWETCVHVSEERYEEDSNIHIKEGDLLITKDGTIGKLAIVDNLPYKTTLNSGVMLIRSNNDLLKYENKYLYYVLKSDIFWNWYESNQKGNATIRHLYQEQFYNFQFPLPDINIQKEIVSELDKKIKKVNQVIKYRQQIIDKLEEYKKSLIYEVVTGKIEV